MKAERRALTLVHSLSIKFSIQVTAWNAISPTLIQGHAGDNERVRVDDAICRVSSIE